EDAWVVGFAEGSPGHGVKRGEKAAPDDADADCHAGPPAEPISSFRSTTCLDYCLAPVVQNPALGGQVGRAHRVAMLGTGLIGEFYTMTLHGRRSPDRVEVAYSRTGERAAAFAERWGIPHHTTDLREAVEHPDTDVVVVGLPNDRHEEAVSLAAAAGQGVLCHQPLGRTA